MNLVSSLLNHSKLLVNYENIHCTHPLVYFTVRMLAAGTAHAIPFSYSVAAPASFSYCGVDPRCTL